MKTSEKYGIIFLLLYSFGSAFGQENDIQYTKSNSIQILSPKINGNHPLGIYLMRLESEFRTQPIAKKRLNIQLSSANVWEPLVTAYKPLLESDREILDQIRWHEREFSFDYLSIPTEKLQLHADAVIKGLHLSYLTPLTGNQEIEINLRSYLFTNGKIPFAFLSSDKFIESFHSNIAGGEDPFARKYYGMDKTEIRYVDEKGKSIQKQRNDFVIPGIEMHYRYFIPSKFLNAQNFYINLGAHLGINTSTYNPSSDFGVSSVFIKQIKLNQDRILQLATGNSFTIPHFVKWREMVNITNQKLIFTIDWQLSYQVLKSTQKKLEWAVNYHHQSPYQNPKGLMGIVLSGERISSHWHYALSHLYENLTVWSFIFNYATPTYAISFYLSEDIKVNNAPDIQTGVQLSFPF